MNLLRQPPFPLEVSYLVPNEETEYLVQIYSDKAVLLYSFEDIVSDNEKNVSIVLPEYFSRFDGTYSLYVYSLNEGQPEEVVVVDTLSINRPYVNPYDFVQYSEDPDDFIYKERIVRNIIDVMSGGFYYRDRTIELTGLGGDFLAMPEKINRINYIYRNNVKVYDRFADPETKQDIYVISPDHSAITIKKEGVYNRHQSAPATLPLAASDSFNLYSDSDDPIAALTKIREFDLFPKDYDYVITGEFGWPVVPQDIQEAAKMLVDDLSCNKLQYVSQYIKEYKTDQFTIKYDDLASRGTGNMIVDKILSQYSNSFYRLGVL
jgi:hypothetical protein